MYKYITGVIWNKGQKLMAINGTEDHIHIFIGIKPTCCLSDLVREVKKASTNMIKEKAYCKCDFKWQEGFGAFSYGHSQIDSVVKYIMRQKEHHRKQSFRDEYVAFLKLFNVAYNDAYILG